MSLTSTEASAVDAIGEISGLDQYRTKATIPLLRAAALAVGDAPPLCAFFEASSSGSREESVPASLGVVTRRAVVLVSAQVKGSWESRNTTHPEGVVVRSVPTRRIAAWQVTYDMWALADGESDVPRLDVPIDFRVEFDRVDAIELRSTSTTRPAPASVRDLLRWIAAGHPAEELVAP